MPEKSEFDVQVEYDIRVVQRYIKLGKITAADYEKTLAGIEDSADNAVQTETRFVSTYATRNHRD